MPENKGGGPLERKILSRRFLGIAVAAAGLAALAWPVASCGASVCGDAVFSPAYFWMWNGKLDADALCAQLEDMRAHGLRNVCIHPFPKGFRDWFPTEMDPGYMTEGYLDVYAKVVRRAGELRLRLRGGPRLGGCGNPARREESSRTDGILRSCQERLTSLAAGRGRFAS